MDESLKRLQKKEVESRPLFNLDTTQSGVDQTRQSLAQRQAVMDAMERESSSPVEPQFGSFSGYDGDISGYQMMESGLTQGSILPSKVRVTQAFGNYNPGIYKQYGINQSGMNTGTDFGVKEGTPIALPPGTWQVMETYDRARGRGRLGNSENRGYGNSVLVRNTQTGETMRFSHLAGVNVAPGKAYAGGTVIGASGATGNVTGPHLDLEYKTPEGQFRDILKSPYARYLFGSMKNS